MDPSSQARANQRQKSRGGASRKHLRPAGPAELRHLPGSDGLPLVGNTLSYLKDPLGYLKAAHERFGPVFRDRMFSASSLAVTGVDMAERLLLDRERIFSNEQAWPIIFGDFFNGGVMLRDFDEHALHRGIIKAAFQNAALAGYSTIIDGVIENEIARINPTRIVSMFPVVKRLLLETASRAFLGLVHGRAAQRLQTDFIQVMDAIHSPIRVSLPFTKWRRGQRSRKRLFAYLLRLVRERRGHENSSGDMLSLLCRAAGEQGERLEDHAIADHLVFMLMAAHDTTASALVNVLLELSRHPKWQERIRDEAFAIGTEGLRYEDMDSHAAAGLCFREALRLHAPVRSIPRRTLRPTVIGDHPVPAGTNIWFNVDLHHRDPSTWTSPDTFDPERFSESRAEHRKHKFTWVPFGAGAHTCLGLTFAELEVKAFVHRLLRKYRLELDHPERVIMQNFPFPKPADDLRLRLTALT